MEKPRLIASDMDGTLLTESGELSTRTSRVLERATKNGVPVVLVTARPPRSLPGWLTDVSGLNGYVICGNGAMVYEIASGLVCEILGILNPASMSNIVAALEQNLPGVGLAIDPISATDSTALVLELLTEQHYTHPWPLEITPKIVTRAEIATSSATKLLVRHHTMSSTEMWNIAQPSLCELANVTFSSDSGMLEISALGVDKAAGLAKMANKLRVLPEQVIAFGDMPNDLPMLNWAGHGVAVANAHPDVLLAAKEITASNNEDGVAQVLERWF